MISVQNRLQQLNGNKKLWAGLLVIFIISVSFVSIDEADHQRAGKDKSLLISYLLPFQADKLDELSVADAKYFELSDLSIDYYRGARLAIDSLQNEGISLKVNVIDTELDSAKISTICNNPLVRESDLVFGPVFPQEFSGINRYSKENKVYVISPIAPSSLENYRNPYFVIANNTLERHAEALAEFALKKMKINRYLIIRNGLAVETRFSKPFVNAIDSLGKKVTHKEIVVSKENMASIKSQLNPVENNVILIPSADQAFVITLLKYFRSLDDSYEITLLVHPKWTEFTNVDIVQLQKFKVHISTSFNPDYRDSVTKEFVQKYRDTYHDEPSEFAFRGYDQTMYFISERLNEGRNFYSKLKPRRMLSTGYEFGKPSADGLKNKFLYIMKYEDYKLIEQ